MIYSSDSEASSRSPRSRTYESELEEEEEEEEESVYEIKDFVLACPDLNWPWGQGLSIHETNMSFCDDTDPELIERFPHKPWNWFELSKNSKISLDFISAHPEFPWNWTTLSKHPFLVASFVLKHADKPWDWYELTRRVVQMSSGDKEDVVARLVDKPWNWEELSGKMDLAFIEAHPTANWDWHHVALSHITDLAVLDRHADKFDRRTWEYLSATGFLEEWFINKYVDKPWNWSKLSNKPQITPEFVHSHIEKDWNWLELSRNETITPSFVRRYSNKAWNTGQLYNNPFDSTHTRKRKREKSEKEMWLRSTRLNTGGDMPVIRNIMDFLYF